MIEIDGAYTTARVMGLSDGELQDTAREQIRRMVDHEAFRNPVRVMPDTHRGAGSVIGFTMPIGERVVPNVVGVDIGCGLLAVRLADTLDDLGLDHETVDRRVRDTVPMGWGREGIRAPDREYYHLVDDFPWERVNDRLRSFVEMGDQPYVENMTAFLDEGGYDGKAYLSELVTERAGRMSHHFDMDTAITQVGTLGAGNHFIEIGESAETGAHWVIIHSGSRGLGANTAQYWQERAVDPEAKRQAWYGERASQARAILDTYPDDYVVFDADAVGDKELLDWLQGGKGEDFVNYEAISRQDRERVRQDLKRAIPEGSPPDPDLDDSLDYLEGEAAAGYLIDMLFAQEYAVENRRMMAEAVASALETDLAEVLHARHNVVDFRDGIIRKGATRAYEGERVVIPFNMREGTFVVEGRSNEDWHCSVCHGAGRVMSRRQAREEFTEDDLRNTMAAADAYATEFPVDEAPGAYKSTALIEDAIEPTASVVDRLEVLHNFKPPSN